MKRIFDVKKSGITRLFISFLILVTLASAAFAGDEWVEVKSKNFFLVGDAKEKDIRNVATKLEQFREVLRQVLPKLNINSAIPTTVLVFKNDKSYNPYRPLTGGGKPDEGIAGYFMPGQDINYITLSTDGKSEDTYQVIFHEYIHFIVNNNLERGKVPSWFNEGLAEYYATFAMENDRKALLGDLQYSHLEFLAQYKMMPLDTLFNADYQAMHKTGGRQRQIYYAQAWALLHYMMQGNQLRTPQMNNFIQLLMNGKDTRTAFQTAFETDYATLEKELNEYIKRRKFMATAITFNEKLIVDSEMTAKQINEAEALAHLGDFLLHFRRYDEAAAKLEKSISLNPNHALANAALGRVRIEQNRVSEAKPFLEKALSLDDKNYLINYYYGEALFSEYVRPGASINQIPAEASTKIRAALERTIALKPDYTEAYRMLAFVNLVNNENLDQSVDYLNKALSIQPGNESIAYILGQIYLRQENFAKSRPIFQNLAQNAPDTGLRASAQSFLNLIGQMEKQKQKMEKYENETSFSNQPSDDEPPMSNEDFRNKSLNEALIKPNANEKRIVGYLTKITCPRDVVNFSIRTDAGVINLSKKDFQSIEMRAFTQEATDFSVGCDTVKKDYYVVVIYKPETNAKSKTDGEVLSLEFMPTDFKLIQ